jgi:DNA repair exonuclease SbcCD ATPase subunit
MKSSREEPVTLPLAEVDSWLQERAKQSDFSARCREIYGRMDGAAKELKEDISSLKSASPDDGAPPKLLRAGVAARGEVIKQLETLSLKLEPPRKDDLDGISQHHWALVKGLERTVTTFGRAKSYVAALFPRNIESINSHLTEISRLLVDLEKAIGEKRKVQEESWFCRETALRLKGELSGIIDLRAKMQRDEAALSELSSQLSSLERQAEKLEASDDGKRTRELKSSLEKKIAEKVKAEAELHDLIAPLNKALARMNKQGSSARINLQHEKVFESLGSCPASVQDKEIAGALNELQGHLAVLGLKDRKKEKVLDHIDLLITKRSLEDVRGRLQTISEDIGGMQFQIEEGSREGLRLKEEMSQARKEKRSLEEAFDQAKTDLAQLSEKASSDERDLNDRLARISGRQMNLDLSAERR